MKTIAVLMTVHNRKEKTLLCLHNLFGQELPEGCTMDVYLTDDGCTDGTPEAVAKQFPQVNIIKGNGDLFWNRGMYTAWQAASARNDYDFYLWLNDDTFAYQNMLGCLIKASTEKQDKAIIVGATRASDNPIPTYGGRMEDGSIAVPQGCLKKVCHFNGNIVLIPKYAYHLVGNLDYYFTHSKGDFDYGMRANKLGIEIFQAGEYLGECDVHPTIDKWCNPNVPFMQRWRMLHRPNGMPPKETFHLERRHYGEVKAAFHWCTIYMRCLCPSLWIFRMQIDKKE